MTARLLAGAALCAVVAASGGTTAMAQDEIVMGMALAYSGWMEAYDGEAAKMADLWVEQKNAAGGVLGRQIRQIKVDTKTDRVEGAKAGQDLIDQGAGILLVSADYDYGAPAALQAQSADVLSVFVGASDPKAGVIGVGPLSFTANNAAQLEGAVMGEWGYEEQGLRKGFMLTDETIEYNKSICAGYSWAFPAKGGEIAGEDVFRGLDPTISSQITRISDAIREEGVDHIMLCSTNPGAASSVRQMRAAGIEVPILSGTAMDGTYWLNSVPGLKDFYLPVQALTVDDPRPEVAEITAAYEAKYGGPPTTQYAYPIYAFLDLWAKAVEEAETTDGTEVVDIMNTYDNEPTVLGPRTFTPDLHVQTQMPMFVVSYENDARSPVAEWTISDTIPTEVLYRIGQ